MKTNDLIAALSADVSAPIRGNQFTGIYAIVGSAAVSLGAMLVTMGFRPDIVAAMATWRFDVKLALVALATLLTTLQCLRLANPLARPSALPIAIIVVLLAGAVAAELLVSTSTTWASKLVGTNAMVCLVAVPALSLAPLAALLFVLRSGAPTAPAAVGAAAGLAAAAIGATIYATHCPDDSPLFVATWYALAALPVIALGSICGRYWLRW